MGSILVAAWAQVLKRARADWLILGAAALTIVLATTLLSAGPIYGSAVSVSGLRRTLEAAPVQQANVQISLDSNTSNYSARDAQTKRALKQAFAPIGATIEGSGRSASYALPGQSPNAVTKLMVFSFFPGIDRHAHLVAGSWPGRGDGGVVEAAVPRLTATRLGLRPGSELSVQSRAEATRTIQVRVSGVYQVDRTGDPYWWGDQLDTSGVQTGGSFTTYGPFLVDPTVFFGPVSADGAHFTWRAFPDFGKAEVSMLPTLAANLNGIVPAVNRGLPPNDQAFLDTGLGGILATAQRSLLVTQAGVLIVTLELAVLAGYALLLTAGLLVDQRAIETGLLHSRGASTGQIATMSLMEALVLAIPAALAGPWLAVFSLEILNRIGPLAAVTVTLHPQVSPAAYILAFASALACVAALALPARQAARTFVQARTSRGRQLARSLLQRTRIDLILVAAAIIGLWQLRLYGAPITQTVQGSLGIDPLLVAAPAIGLLAGAVIALRAIPLLARLVDMGAPRARRLVPALGAWQLARRPNVYTRSALLLMLAIAIGVFALSYSSTWALSQQDQANYQVGADVRLQPDIRPGSSIPQLDLAGAQSQLAGVDATMPVLRDFLSPASATGGTLLALDSTRAAQIISLRPDLAAGGSSALMRQLAAKRPHLVTIPLAGKPEQFALDVRVALDPPPPQPAGPPPPFGRVPNLAPSIVLTLQDGRGLLYQLASQSVPADGAAHRLVWPLAFQMSNGHIAAPQYPISIADAEIEMQPGASRSGEIDITGLQTTSTLQGGTWAPGRLPSTGIGWSSTQFGLASGAKIDPAAVQPPDGLAARFTSPPAFGFGSAQLNFRLTMEGGTVSDDLTALASQAFLDSTSSKVGDTVPVDLEGQQRQVHIAGALQGFPTLAPDQANLIVDLPTLEMVKFQADSQVLNPAEWWLATSPGRHAEVTSALRAAPYSSVEVDDRVDQGQALREDPVALGTVGALSLGYVAAALFAAVGFLVNAAVTSWSRQREFALLRAVGLSTGQLSGWLSLENGILVAISLVGGTLLGLAMSWLILPAVSLTQGGNATQPPAQVVVPWPAVTLLEGVSLAVLLLAIAGLALALRRISLGAVLRLGEE